MRISTISFTFSAHKWGMERTETKLLFSLGFLVMVICFIWWTTNDEESKEYLHHEYTFECHVSYKVSTWFVFLIPSLYTVKILFISYKVDTGGVAF